VFKALAGPGRKFLALCDLQLILGKHFNALFSYEDICTAVTRQGGSAQMRYTDYLNLIKPRNSEFSEYVNRRMNADSEVGFDLSLSFGMKEVTRNKFGKLFRDMVKMENDLENLRKTKLKNISIFDLFRQIDTDLKGFCTLHDYN
jgi:hypothetical protein